MKQETKECAGLVRAWLKMNKIQLAEETFGDGVLFRGRERLLSGIAPACSRLILVDDDTVECRAAVADYVKEPFRQAVAEYLMRVNVDWPSCKLSLDMDEGTVWSSCSTLTRCVAADHAPVLFNCYFTASQNLDRWLPGIMLIQERGLDAAKAFKDAENWDKDKDLVPRKREVTKLGEEERYKMAVELAREFGSVTSGFLSDRLCINYFDAATLIDQMQTRGVVKAAGVEHVIA